MARFELLIRRSALGIFVATVVACRPTALQPVEPAAEEPQAAPQPPASPPPSAGASGDTEKDESSPPEPTAAPPSDANEDHSSATVPPPPPPPPAANKAPLGPVKFVFAGDMILGRYKPQGLRHLAPVGAPVLDKVKTHLDADFVVGNFETPAVRSLPEESPHPKDYVFGSTKEMVAPLAAAGFNVMSLANNHADDLGAPGLLETPQILRELGITPVGVARPLEETEKDPFPAVRMKAQGRDVSFISVATRLNRVNGKGLQVPYATLVQLPKKLEPTIVAEKKRGALVIVLVHWGDEYSPEPLGWQRRSARSLIDLGVDVVIGHHPHVLQEVESYRGGVIAYSMGNFLFDNPNQNTRTTGLLELSHPVPGACELRLRFSPIEIHRSPYFHPVPAKGTIAALARQAIQPDPEGDHPATISWKRDGEALVAATTVKGCPGQ